MRRPSLGPLAMGVGVIALIWPIGVGGQMPLGGDASQFSIGLMDFLHRSLRQGRLPLWNDLWGFGFPALAESQMGVYYPPHLLLYGLLGTETAYTTSLVLHMAWAALGAYFAARMFGASIAGASLSGFIFAGSGFFQIHLAHPWAYTVGSWTPWAWGLAWKVVQRGGGRRAALGLAAVLALQVLPGHFQLAFITQCTTMILIAVGGMIRHAGGPRAARGMLGALAAVLAVVPLSAMQVWPTWGLARLAESDRTFDYLSGFATSPLHLVSYVAPGLFQRSPLWRPVAWDPFHTSPEEHLGYVGLVPLFLAIGSVRFGYRHDIAIRVLTVLLAVALCLSLGPYLPGFRLLIAAPGFSFFRAPARWGLAVMLALALLAGLGLDRLDRWPRLSRRLRRFVLVATLPPLLLVMSFELAMMSTEGRGIPALANAFESARRALPWEGDPSFLTVMSEARTPSRNPIVISALTRRGQEPNARLDQERHKIYFEELAPTVGLLLAMIGLTTVASRARPLSVGMVVLTGVDLIALSQHRDLETGPIRPLIDQSPIMARLSELPRGTRSIDPFGNLSMAAGMAPLRAYRTLDLPALVPLVQLASMNLDQRDNSELIDRAVELCGIDVRIFESRGQALPSPGWENSQTIVDATLAGWSYGPNWVARRPEASRYAIESRIGSAPRAWLVPREVKSLKRFDDPSALVSEALKLSDSQRLEIRSTVPERRVVDGLVAPESGSATIVINSLYYPEWQGVWIGPNGSHPAEVQRVFALGEGAGGWQAVPVPDLGPGPWRLELAYAGRAESQGLSVSAVAWAVWAILFTFPTLQRSRNVNPAMNSRKDCRS